MSEYVPVGFWVREPIHGRKGSPNLREVGWAISKKLTSVSMQELRLSPEIYLPRYTLRSICSNGTSKKVPWVATPRVRSPSIA